MFKQKPKLFIALFCIIAVIFTSCGPNNTKPKDDNSAAITKNYPVPQENRRGYDAQFSICPSSTSDGFYRVNSASKSMWYYDAESQKGLFLCAQPGCAHNDETCQAWIGDVLSFTEYHGDILAIRQYEDGSADFIKKDLSSGEIEVYKTWKNSDGEYYEAYINNVADNTVILLLRQYTVAQEGGILNTDSSDKFLLYDLETGESREIFADENEETLKIMAMYKDHVAVMYTTPRDEMLSEEEFHKQYGEGENYSLYLQSGERYQIRLYDLNTNEYTVLVDKDLGFIRYTDPNYVYENRIVYVCEDIIYLFDLKTLEKREFLKKENIVNYWLMDHKVFYITGKENQYQYYYADIDDAVPIELKNDGDTEVMKFSVYYESESFFINSGANEIISKEDFYAERYENSINC